MKAGLLDRRVSFKRPVLSDDGLTSIETMEHHCDRWASFKPVNGREVFETMGREARGGGSFWVRSDEATRVIDATFLLTFEDVDHEIVSVNPLGRRDMIEIVAVRSDKA